MAGTTFVTCLEDSVAHYNLCGPEIHRCRRLLRVVQMQEGRDRGGDKMTKPLGRL